MNKYEDEDRLKDLEDKASEIRKLLFGALQLAKDVWEDELKQKREGVEIIKALEEAEEAFVDDSLTDRLERLENILDVIHKRAKGIFVLMDYQSKTR